MLKPEAAYFPVRPLAEFEDRAIVLVGTFLAFDPSMRD